MLPLEGVRVVDLTRVLAGPYCTWILACLGADVIKVEQPDKGDQARDIPPFVGGESIYFMSLNRGKRGITLDLKGGREVMRRLLVQADVLVENFAPGVMKRLGLDYPAVAEINPRLVYVSISGFGQTGPACQRRAYDQIVQALGGLMSITGEPDRPPVRVGISVGDLAAGLFASTALLAALRQQEHTGTGQYLDVSMLDCLLALMENPIARYLATGQVPSALGNRHPTVTPIQSFAAADGAFVVAVGNDAQWQKLCAAIGRPDLAGDERFARNADRNARCTELEGILQGVLQTRPRTEWIVRLETAGVPAAPIHSVADVVGWEQTAARRMVVDVDHPAAGQTRFVGFPVQTPGAAGYRNSPSPTLGEHSPQVLRELGFSDDEIETMRREGVV